MIFASWPARASLPARIASDAPPAPVRAAPARWPDSSDVGIHAREAGRRKSGQIEQANRPHPDHRAYDPARAPSPRGRRDLAAQTCDASYPLHTPREIEVLANRHVRKAAERVEDFFPDKNRLIARAGAADARAEANQRANQYAQRMRIVEAHVETAA